MKLNADPRLSYSIVFWGALSLFAFLTCCCGLVEAEKRCRKKDVIVENPRDGICGAISIRNNITNFRKLENCTVIMGNVHISLIDQTAPEEFEKYRFPQLVEITGNLMLFRVKNLRTLRTLFPNLAIIKGQNLFYNYALVIYEMRDLEEIGLINLRTISRGGVRITKNKKLCYVDTVDWSKIAVGADVSDHHFMDNKEGRSCANYCPDTCPTSIVDNVSAKRCWTPRHCQKNIKCRCKDNGPCMDNGTCCHNFCLAGCRGTGPSDCLSCKKVVYNNTCLPNCPAYTFMYSETRCLLDKECLSIHNRTWNGENNSKLLKATGKGEPNRCVLGDCPPGYMVSGFECVKCKDFCPKICAGSDVNSIQDLQQMKGCSKIVGSLNIHIMGGSNVAQEMEKNLGEIREVTSDIKISHSFALLHLHFFKKLEIIGGNGSQIGVPKNKRNALLVTDNVNLQELFPPGHNLTITSGLITFIGNRRLCDYKILEFVNSVNATNHPEQMRQYAVTKSMNGDLKPCSPRQITLNVTQITHESAVLVWEKEDQDQRQLLTYNINYKEVQSDDSDVNIFLGRDACSNDFWLNKEQQPTDDEESFQMGLLPKLKPYTKYAVYVQAFTLTTATHSAMTDVITFYTKPYYPSEPLNLEVNPTEDPSELHIKWKPPRHPNGVVTHYKLIYIKHPLKPEEFDRRNYCQEPLVEMKNKGKAKVVEEQKKLNVSGDCCDCPKKKDLEMARDQRQMEVYFENHLQNNVYCKRFDTLPHYIVIDSNLTDRWKTMNKEALMNKVVKSIPGNGDLKTMIENNVNSSVKRNHGEDGNAVVLAPRKKNYVSETWLHGDIDVYNFTETVINNLEPFMEYIIELQACHDTSVHLGGLCSNSRAISAGRTKANPINDKINESSITVEHVTNNTGDVIIRWAAPPNPNGLILKYSLKYKRASQDNLVAQEICINRQEYKEMKGYRLSGLEPGNWTYQVFAMSLTGKNTETREKFFIIDEQPGEKDKSQFVIIAVVAFLVLLIIGVAICVILLKQRLQKGSLTVVSENLNYLSTDLINPMDGWEVDRDKIKLLQPLGKGSFGMVFKGVAKGIRPDDDPDAEMLVAVKTVNDRASFFDRREFLKEATTMKAFDCYHVVKLLGVVSTGQPALVIMELMATDLKNYLREHRPDEVKPGSRPLCIQDILQMAGEIADGMAYLADKKFVHRDLAARNCMVAEDATVKIGDFGMARDIYETDYYRKGGKGMLPVRWMAPESLRDGVFTSLSDVWSFGVVLWEMVTFAAQPYQGLSNEEVVKFVSNGSTMLVPDECPEQIEVVMKQCWRKQRERPSFLGIIQFLKPYLHAKFREESFYFNSQHTRDEEGAEGDSEGMSCSLQNAFDKGAESVLYQKSVEASARLGPNDQPDFNCQSQASFQSGMEGDDTEFCSDNLMYDRDPPMGHFAHHERGDGSDWFNSDCNRYCDEDDDDESDSRCLMLGDDGPAITNTTGSCFNSLPLSSSPSSAQNSSSHHHPSPHSANQGLFELQPLIAPPSTSGLDSMHHVKKATTPLSSPSSSPLSSSWNPHPHHNKSSLPTTTTTGTSPINNSSSLNCSPVSAWSPSDYLGYNPSPSHYQPQPPSQSNDTTTHPDQTLANTTHPFQQPNVAGHNNGNGTEAGLTPPSPHHLLPTPPKPSSSLSSPPSTGREGETDRLLWPSKGSSSSNDNNTSNNSISRPSLRLPVLNQPPGRGFHRTPPSASRAVSSDSQRDNNSQKTSINNDSQTHPPARDSDTDLAGRLLSSSNNRNIDGDGTVPPPSSSSFPSSSSTQSSSPSSHPHQPLQSPSSSPPPPPSPSHQPPPPSRVPGVPLDTTGSGDGSKESTKSSQSSTGSHSSVPLMNGFINGHAPPSSSSASSSSSSIQPRTALC